MAKRETRIVPFIGLSLYILVDVLCFHSSTAFSGVSGFLADLYSPLLILSRILTFIVVAVATSRLVQLEFSRLPVALSCAGISAAAFVCIWLGAPSGGAAFVVFGAVLLGASQGAAGLFWLSTLTSFDYRGSYLYLLAGHTVATIFCAAALLFAFSWILPLTACCAVVSNILLLFAPAGTPAQHSLRSRGFDVARSLGKAVATVCLFALASGVMVSVASDTVAEVEPAYAQYAVLGISGVVLVIMFIPALAFKQPLKLENGYKVALPLSALGFLVLPGFTDLVPPFIAGTLTTTGYMVTGIILSCIIAEVARTARMSPIALFSSAQSVTLSFLLIGLLIGGMFAQYLDETNVGLALIVAGCLYLLVLGASWFFSLDRKSEMPHVHVSLERIANDHDFTEQECLIFYQLVEGRTLSRIAGELYLSVSSVKYHTQKIYRAFDVHSRSELSEAISKVEFTSPSLRKKQPQPQETLLPRRVDSATHIAEEQGLSKRETEVLILLAQGETMVEIARTFEISENTARTHIKRVYHKLGVHSKQDIIDLCRERE